MINIQEQDSIFANSLSILKFRINQHVTIQNSALSQLAKKQLNPQQLFVFCKNYLYRTQTTTSFVASIAAIIAQLKNPKILNLVARNLFEEAGSFHFDNSHFERMFRTFNSLLFFNHLPLISHSLEHSPVLGLKIDKNSLNSYPIIPLYSNQENILDETIDLIHYQTQMINAVTCNNSIFDDQGYFSNKPALLTVLGAYAARETAASSMLRSVAEIFTKAFPFTSQNQIIYEQCQEYFADHIDEHDGVEQKHGEEGLEIVATLCKNQNDIEIALFGAYSLLDAQEKLWSRLNSMINW